MDAVLRHGRASVRYGMAMHEGGLRQASVNLDATWRDVLDIVYGD